MKISDSALDDFIRIYKEEFKTDIDMSQASEMALRLVTLYELLAKKAPYDENITLPDDPAHPPIGFRTS
jgi:hypothetical protein